ncbi:MAG: dipeptide ABC transporter ATP-binding protein [Rhodospirillaceae bacterium]|jgi:oligopeptide/dipeptide ABC transporter ATP-binding protein
MNEQTSMSDSPIIEARNLSVHFSVPGKGFRKHERQTVRAVHDVSLSLKPGKTLALVGESGCGKTTLVRALSLLIKPTAGEVHFDGTDITHYKHRQLRPLRRQIQMVFQDPYSSLNPRMPVGSLISEPLVIHGIGNRNERRDKVAELLVSVGLNADIMNRYPHQFSGGQRQRIAIARALALDPNLIILDEPVSALDVSVQSQVLNLLQDLQEKLGLTYLFIGHNLTVIRYIADEVAVMYLGEVVEHAETQELFSNPRHPYTQALLRAAPVHGVGKRKHTTQLKGDPPSPLAPPPGCSFHPRCPAAQDICATKEPVFEDVPNHAGHRAACHFKDQVPT